MKGVTQKNQRQTHNPKMNVKSNSNWVGRVKKIEKKSKFISQFIHHIWPLVDCQSPGVSEVSESQEFVLSVDFGCY